jgi:hypothetical protein
MHAMRLQCLQQLAIAAGSEASSALFVITVHEVSLNTGQRQEHASMSDRKRGHDAHGVLIIVILVYT